MPLAGRLFLASLPALAVPGCLESGVTADAAYGLDYGTVGQALDVDASQDTASPEDRAA